MKKPLYTSILCVLIFGMSSGLYAQAGKKTTKVAKEAAKEPVKETPVVVDPAPVTPTPETTVQPTAFDNKYKWDLYFRVNQTTINSATAANGLKMDGVFFLNRFINNRTVLIFPTVGEFKGQIYDFGIGVRHNWLFKSNWLFSGGSLADTSSSSFYYEQGVVAITTGTSTSTSAYTTSSMYNYSNNTLKTGRISYAAEIFPWAKSNPILAKLGFRFGPEIYGNGAKMYANYLLTAAPSVYDFVRTREIKNNEGFANMFIGLSYAYEINPKNQIDFTLDYFKSVAAAGSYYDTSSYLFPQLSASSPTFPVKLTGNGSYSAQMSGYRFNLGYKFQIFENMGIRLSYGYWDASHEIANSKIKDGSGSLTTISGFLTRNLLGAGVGTMTGLGPNPSSNDKRTQIGFEVVFRF